MAVCKPNMVAEALLGSQRALKAPQPHSSLGPELTNIGLLKNRHTEILCGLIRH